MKAGKTNFDCGTRIRIVNLQGDESFLNGREGTLTHPFGMFPIGDVGVYLDEKSDMMFGICNLMLGEFKVI